MQSHIHTLEVSFLALLEQITTLESLDSLKNDFLGKAGKLNVILSGLKDLSPEDKKTVGLSANQLKNRITQQIAGKESLLRQSHYRQIETEESIDLTLSFSTPAGGLHPFSLIDALILPQARALGFEVKMTQELFGSTCSSVLDTYQTQDYQSINPELWISIDDYGDKRYEFFVPKSSFSSLVGSIECILQAFSFSSVVKFPYWNPKLSGAQKIILPSKDSNLQIGSLGFLPHHQETLGYFTFQSSTLGLAYFQIHESSVYRCNQDTWIRQFS